MENNNTFDQEYYNDFIPIQYKESEQLMKYYNKVADNIIKTLNPKTVLDVNCSIGYLVTALRDRGVEAYGIDVSEYIISGVSDYINPYCKVASLLEPLPSVLPQKYDLIIAIGFDEYSKENREKFIQNICMYTDTIIYSPKNDNSKNETYSSIQKCEYCIKELAKYQFYNDIKNAPTYISYNAKKFYRTNNFSHVIEDYEYTIRMKTFKFLNEKENFENKIRELSNSNLKLENKYNSAKCDYLNVFNSKSYRITKFPRSLYGILRTSRLTRSFFKVVISIKKIGFSATFKKAINRFRKTKKYKIQNYRLTKDEIERQKSTKFSMDIKFSILVPLYNTPEKFLNEMIISVKEQTYQIWELCLADGSDNEHKYVGEICKKYAKNDLRIIYKKLEKNDGISENTNRCIEMSTGEYLGLLDHDDILHQSALFEVMKTIDEKSADFIYTDENTFSKKPEDAYCPHFKPDFAPDNLRTQNYICHFSVFSRDLLKKAGMFRKEFDGSQDFDMVLRLTENADCIMHIPKILYFWRAHKNSVALNSTAKPYATISAKKALSAHLNRIGLEGTVIDSVVPSTYKINYKINGNPLVSILIPNKDHVNDLEKCINSIVEKTTYNNYEIIIIENNSFKVSTFKYYQKLLSAYDNIYIAKWDREFNYSAINNFGFDHAHGDYIILLNNDTTIISPSWIEEMLMFAQRSDVGAVGAKLYYPDDTVQHAGVILGVLTLAGHSHRNFKRNDYGYMGRLTFVQNLSTVTAACMMIPRHIFEEITGFDETFEVAFNDIDLCMRIRKNGYNIVWTPYAELYHYESKSRGYEDTPEKQKRFEGEVLRFQTKWRKELEAGDPYYNPNLTLEKEDFSLKM